MSDKKLSPPTRAEFVAFEDVHSRWMDNDAYGHINNVVYYSFFDTAVNRYLIERNVLDIAKIVHVYVDRVSNKPTPIPQNVRIVLQSLVKTHLN